MHKFTLKELFKSTFIAEIIIVVICEFFILVALIRAYSVDFTIFFILPPHKVNPMPLFFAEVTLVVHSIKQNI